jgi:hypothetical protein
MNIDTSCAAPTLRTTSLNGRAGSPVGDQEAGGS